MEQEYEFTFQFDGSPSRKPVGVRPHGPERYALTVLAYSAEEAGDEFADAMDGYVLLDVVMREVHRA